MLSFQTPGKKFKKNKKKQNIIHVQKLRGTEKKRKKKGT